MKLHKLVLLTAFVLLFVIGGGTARADSVPITNPSFESLAGPLTSGCGPGCFFNGGPIIGWTIVNGGPFQPGAFLPTIPDGSLVAFANATGSISQTLTGNSVLGDSLYTLSLFVGNRTDNIGGNYTLSLDTILGGVTTTLCSFSGNAQSITPGTFQSEGCNYTSGSSVPAGNLFLQFAAGSGQLDVDAVSLTVQPATGVPEPSSILLLSIGVLFVMFTVALRGKNQLSTNA